jgi:hypothetical protein
MFFARMINRRRILLPEDSSLGIFFARSILHQIILRSKKTLEADDSSLGKFFVDIFFVRAENYSPDSSSPDSSSPESSSLG